MGKKGRQPPFPLPPGFRTGGIQGITASLLDKHENLVVQTLKNGQETAKLVSTRLKNVIEQAGAKWKPNRDFLEMLKISAEVTVKLSAEYRQLVKVRASGDLTDEELRDMMKPLMFAVLRAMTDEEFGELLDEYEELRKGEGVMEARLHELEEAQLVTD